MGQAYSAETVPKTSQGVKLSDRGEKASQTGKQKVPLIAALRDTYDPSTNPGVSDIFGLQNVNDTNDTIAGIYLSGVSGSSLDRSPTHVMGSIRGSLRIVS